MDRTNSTLADLPIPRTPAARWLMRGGLLQTLDEERIMIEAERHAQRMVRRGMSRVREYKS
jgi:hypothetical protein